MPPSEDSPELDMLRAEVARLTAALAALGAGAQADRLHAAGAEALANAEDWARAHPGPALGLAAGLGFALGLLIGGRR